MRNTSGEPRFRQKGLRLAAMVAALFLGACMQNINQTENYAFPEQGHKDWKILRDNVKAYEAARSGMMVQNLPFIQSDFRNLTESHSGDRIGDEANFYVGRIYYDMRDYHDARVAFALHKERYPNSPFGPTILELEADMEAEHQRYQAWLKESRTVSTGR